MNYSVRLAVLTLPMILSAQAPAKYRYVTTSTTFLEKAAFDHSIETMKGAGIDVTAAAATNGVLTQTVTSIVSLSTRDSAGGTIYQISVDSSVVDEGAYRKADRAARAIVSPATRPPTLQTTQPSRTVTVFVRNGQPVSLALNGQLARGKIDPVHAWSSLQLQLPGLVYLIPSADMPARIGAVYQDTVHNSRSNAPMDGTMMTTDGSTGPGVIIPASVTSDTLISVWHRASADTVHSVLSKSSVLKSDNGGVTRAASNGLYELVFAGPQVLRDVKGKTTVTNTTLAAANGNIPAPRKTEQSYALVKMP